MTIARQMVRFVDMPSSSRRRTSVQNDGHPIAVVASRTGLSQDVLRVWERRYGAVAPTRSAGNQRLYSDEDITRFRLLASATSHGRSIRNVAKLSTAVLERLVADDASESESDRGDSVEQVGDTLVLQAALAFTVALDAAGLDHTLRHSIARAGLPTFLEVDAPALMRRVGDDWAAGRMSIAQEHLASTVVLTVLFDAIRALPTASSAPRLLVATLSQERHGVGAALAAGVAALEGWMVIQLGVDVPAVDVATAAAATGARAVALSIVYDDDRAHVLRELAGIRRATNATVPIIVGGATAVSLSANLAAAGGVVCRSFAEFRSVLAKAVTLSHPDAS